MVSFLVPTISIAAEFERALVTWLLSRWDANGNRNGLWHCHSAIVQKLVALLLHNSWTTMLFDCIIPVSGSCNAHITRICTLLIPIDCRRASGRPHFRIVPDLYQHPVRFSRDSWTAIYDSSWIRVHWWMYRSRVLLTQRALHHPFKMCSFL